MFSAECPLCGEGIRLDVMLKFGQRLHCPACEALLEIVGMDPIKLDWLYFDQYLEEDDNLDSENYRVAECPLCRHEFNTSPRLQLGQCVLCPACDVELEVVWLNPVELSWPYGEGYQLYGHDCQGDIDYIK
jgi:lysine biosynthesis protein LysW